MRFNLASLATVGLVSFALTSSSGAATLLTDDLPAVYSGTHVWDFTTNTVIRNSLPAGEAEVVVYDNLRSPSVPTASISALNSALPIFGDRLTMTQGGRLEEFYFTINNPSAGTGSMTALAMSVGFYDFATTNSLGGFTATLNYAANPLAPGFYRVDGFDGLSALNINLTSDIVVTTEFARVGSTRQGIIVFNPVSIGSSPQSMYYGDTSAPDGFYNFGSPTPIQANPGFLIVVPEPTTLAAVASVGLIAIRRRRA